MKVIKHKLSLELNKFYIIGLTPRQQQANQNQEAITQGDIYTDQKFQQIRQQTTQRNRHAPDVDSLTDRLLLGLQTGHPTPPKL